MKHRRIIAKPQLASGDFELGGAKGFSDTLQNLVFSLKRTRRSGGVL
jgi:hypothetical protein